MAEINTKQLFGISILTSQHKDIRRLKRYFPTSIHGNKIWASSLLLMKHFQTNPIPKHWKVLELGCGWGLTAIFLNKTYQCPITALDADKDVEPYLQLHAEINQVNIEFVAKKIEDLTPDELSQYDLIIAADVCFWDELEDIHFNLINHAIDAGVNKIIYADPIRSPFEALAKRCKESFFAEVEELELESPAKAHGQLMIIKNKNDPPLITKVGF